MLNVTVTPLHAHYREDHLAHVKAEMLHRGPPRLRGYFDALTATWFMREGTHRLRAAKALGITPVLVAVPWWRSRKSLDRARHAARRTAHVFARVDVECDGMGAVEPV
jgi:hypothetical protein